LKREREGDPVPATEAAAANPTLLFVKTVKILLFLRDR